jgi:hypothetical protein
MASAQSFINPGFETGDLTGWTVAFTSNGTSTVQNVVSYDIDGPGPLGASLTAQFSVGQAVAGSTTEGVNLTQSLLLTGGVQYTIGFDWSSWRNSTTNNAEGGVFSVLVDGNLLTTASSGSTNSATPHYGHLSTTFTPGTTGTYQVGARITRPFTPGGQLFQHVDNFLISSPVPEPASLCVLGLGILAATRRRRRS